MEDSWRRIYLEHIPEGLPGAHCARGLPGGYCTRRPTWSTLHSKAYLEHIAPEVYVRDIATEGLPEGYCAST